MPVITSKAVFDIIKSCPSSYLILYDVWSELARELGIEGVDIKKLRQDFIWNKISFPDLLIYVLDNWCTNQNNKGSLSDLCKAFKECQLNEIVDVLEDKFEVVSTSIISICSEPETGCIKYNVIAPTNIFVGRKSEMENLHHHTLQKHGGYAVVSQATSVSGLGGIGKTQLIRKYILMYSQDFDDNVLWFPAEDEGILEESFRILCKDRLQISTKDADGTRKTIESIVFEVYRYFKSSKLLVVFDNAERCSWLSRYFPTAPGFENVYVIITSRDREWGSSVKVIDLNVLEFKDAVEMVKLGLGVTKTVLRTKDTDDIEELCRTLQCYPLALSQAISYISEEQRMSRYNARDYLNDYRSKSSELLSYDRTYIEFGNDYARTTFTTWSVTRDKIQSDRKYGKLAMKMLNCMAYYAPDNIPRSAFQDLSQSLILDAKIISSLSGLWHRFRRAVGGINGNFPHKDKHKADHEDCLKNATRLLVRYSMINAEAYQTILSIHRLVQEVIRSEIKCNGEEDLILDLVISQQAKMIMDEEILDHALYSWKNAVQSRKVVTKHCSVLPEIIQQLIRKGRHDDAISFASDVLEKMSQHVKRNSVRTNELDYAIFMVKKGLGQAHWRLDRLDDAKSIFEILVTSGKEVYGEESEFTQEVMECLSNVLNSLGYFQECIRIDKYLLKVFVAKTNEMTPEFLRKTNNLVSNLISVGELKEASQIIQNLIDSNELSMPKDDELTSESLYIWDLHATIMYRIGNYTIAKQIIVNALSINNTLHKFKQAHMTLLLGRTHSQIFSVYGTSNEGLEEIIETLNLHNKILGTNHRNSFLSLQYYANALRRMGDAEQALKIHQDILGNLIEIYTRENKNFIFLLYARFEVGEDLMRGNKVAEGDLEIEHVIQSAKKLLGFKDVRVLEFQFRYGRILFELGNVGKAKRVLGDIVPILEEDVSERKSIVFNMLSQLSE